MTTPPLDPPAAPPPAPPPPDPSPQQFIEQGGGRVGRVCTPQFIR